LQIIPPAGNTSPPGGLAQLKTSAEHCEYALRTLTLGQLQGYPLIQRVMTEFTGLRDFFAQIRWDKKLELLRKMTGFKLRYQRFNFGHSLFGTELLACANLV
jgi:hypothetical protein